MKDKKKKMSDVIFAEGFKLALVGIGRQFNREVAVYRYGECVRILMRRDKMTRVEAIDYMEFNVIGSYVGESTPVFI